MRTVPASFRRFTGMPEQPKLSDSQRHIVESDRLDRHMLVIAPPGSGKTHTISKRIEWLLARRLAEPEQVPGADLYQQSRSRAEGAHLEKREPSCAGPRRCISWA